MIWFSLTELYLDRAGLNGDLLIDSFSVLYGEWVQCTELTISIKTEFDDNLFEYNWRSLFPMISRNEQLCIILIKTKQFKLWIIYKYRSRSTYFIQNWLFNISDCKCEQNINIHVLNNRQ